MRSEGRGARGGGRVSSCCKEQPCFQWLQAYRLEVRLFGDARGFRAESECVQGFRVVSELQWEQQGEELFIFRRADDITSNHAQFDLRRRHRTAEQQTHASAEQGHCEEGAVAVWREKKAGHVALTVVGNASPSTEARFTGCDAPVVRSLVELLVELALMYLRRPDVSVNTRRNRSARSVTASVDQSVRSSRFMKV